MGEAESRREARGGTFSILFLAVLIAHAAIGCALARQAMARRGQILDGPVSYHLAEFAVSTFMGALGAMQGLSVLVERMRGREGPWGYGRWVLAYLVFLVPARVFMWAKYNGLGWNRLSRADVEWLFTRGLPVGISDRDAMFMIAAFIALRLGRSREERARAVVDAREWVGRALAACFVGMAVVNFFMY